MTLKARMLLFQFLASFVGVHAQIRVMAPTWLVDFYKENHGRIDGSTATFGAPFYGERILGRVVWGDPKSEAHCTDQDYTVPAPEEVPVEHHSYKEVRLIHIIMVRRGKCSFVTKVKIARGKGAHAVIIVDKEDSTLTSKQIQNIIVADDGYGENIQIPSVLISKQEGEKMIEAVKASQVIVEFAWDIPTDHTVNMDLWMSAGSKESLKFLKDFAPKRRALNQLVSFTPHYHVFGLKQGQDFNNLCTDDKAQYCAEDPDGSGQITGKLVLDEDIRQLCIHDETKVVRKDDKSSKNVVYAAKYWDYIEKFYDRCPIGPKALTADGFGALCAEKLMQEVHIDVSAINHCMMTNKEEYLRRQRSETAWSPRALRINGWRYSGTMEVDLITRALCAAFKEQPQVCQDLVEPKSPIAQITQPTAPPVEGVGIGTLVTSLFVVALVALGALLLYKKSLTVSIQSALREEVMLEVQAQMDSYKKMPA